MTRYRCIVADPPWHESGGGRIKRGADRHYPLMKTHEIAALMSRLVGELAEPDCHLWLWVTDNHLRGGLAVLDAVGFRYIRTLAWVKPSIGLGYYLRGQHELCLLAVRGTLAPLGRSVPSVVRGPKRRHSQKPDEAFSAIERVSPGPRIELFARAERVGWETWGDEVRP